MRARGAIAVGCAVLLAGCGKSASGPDRPQEVADAEKLIAVGQCETATDKLKTYVSSHPDEREAYLVLGDAWACRAFAKTRDAVDPDALNQADTAYGSVLKLAAQDVRALVSSGAIELWQGDIKGAKAHLEAAHMADAKNLAAINLLALLTDEDDRDDDATNKSPRPDILAAGYSGRKGADAVAGDIPEVCATAAGSDSGMVLDEGKMGKKDSDRAEGQYKMKNEASNRCGRGVVLSDATVGGNVIPAGTVVDFERQTSDGLVFLDKLHPTKKPGKGWALQAISELSWYRQPGDDLSVIVSDRPPSKPSFDNNPWCSDDGHVIDDRYATPDQCARRAEGIAWQQRWSYWGCGSSECKEERDIPAFLAQLHPVQDVVPESVKTTGSVVYIEGEAPAGYVSSGAAFAPVSFETFVYTERSLDPKLVARVSVSDDVAAVIAKASFLSPAEKRALLAGILVTGTPLAIGVRVRGGDFRGASLTLKDGEITLVFTMPAGQDTYVNGELATTTVPPTARENGGVEDQGE